ncbi:hypothetical protein [Archangium minus]
MERATTMYANDSSSYNNIHDNTIHTYGSECFNVKENAHSNTFARNDCRYNDEPLEFTGSLIELRGHNNVLDANVISGSRSYALKLKSDSGGYDKGGNSVTRSTFHEATGAFIRNDHSAPQGTFCGNTFDSSLRLLEGNPVGTPTAPCAGNGDTVPPVAPTGLTATAASSTEVDLSWNASSDNVGVTGYSVYREGVRVCSVTAPAWSDYTYLARVKVGSTGVRNGLVARYGNSNNFYFFVLHNGNVVLNKKVSGSTTTLQSVPFTASTSAFHTLSLVIRDTSIQGYVDGVLRVQGTDSSLTAGKVGFYANGIATYDDVLVTAP